MESNKEGRRSDEWLILAFVTINSDQKAGLPDNDANGSRVGARTYSEDGPSKTIDMHVIAFIFLLPIVLAQHGMDDYDELDHIPCGLHCFINTTVKAYVTNANELGAIHCTGPLQRCTPCCIMKATAHGLTHVSCFSVDSLMEE
ncbi:unnamed protein product [Nippostrongylus brasiliensis]|uniref:Secreted protein n=1 Tax=Nippostrongylus brasiliensis TaxID=27835 RepID=A0A0N4Y773_NIPBR|nr:unnamed protein product [Nippostrongylus brasiliensis]